MLATISMTSTIARKFGRKQSLLVTVIVILLIEFIQLIIETKGDFANGILFFIQRNLNPLAWILIVFFLTFYIVLGGLAAEEILLKKKNYILVSIRNSFVTLFSYCLLLVVINGIVKGNLNDMLLITDKEIRSEVTLFVSTFFLFITITWLIIGYRINNLKSKI